MQQKTPVITDWSTGQKHIQWCKGVQVIVDCTFSLHNGFNYGVAQIFYPFSRCHVTSIHAFNVHGCHQFVCMHSTMTRENRQKLKFHLRLWAITRCHIFSYFPSPLLLQNVQFRSCSHGYATSTAIRSRRGKLTVTFIHWWNILPAYKTHPRAVFWKS